MAACVRSRLNSLSSELPWAGWRLSFFAGWSAPAPRGSVESRKPRSCRISAAKHFSSRSSPSSRCSVPMCLWLKPLGLFGGVGQHPLALVAQRQIDRGRDLLADRGVRFDLLADRFDRGVRAQEPVGQRLVFAQQAQQQVLGLDVRAAELAGLVAREEDDASGFLRISFKHNSPAFQAYWMPQSGGPFNRPQACRPPASAPGRTAARTSGL